MTNSMRTFEQTASAAMASGQAVLYNVAVNYQTQHSTIPWSYRMMMFGQDATTGVPGTIGTALVTNSRYDRNGNVVYLGN